MVAENESSPERGVVKFFIEEKGYGFVTFEGTDYFAHISNVKDRELLAKGDLVDFTPLDFEKGPKAVNIVKVIVDGAEEA